MAAQVLEYPQQIASTASSLSINHFQKVHADGGLILRAPFQRNLVWNAEQQSFLVDSVLRGLPVPEIYIQTQTSADGDERTIVVDGQQRLTACLRFLANKLRLTNDEDLDPRWKGKIFSELEDGLRQRFRKFELITRKLPDLDEDALREVFRRLNKTVEPLEAQELRHAAYTGPFVKLVEQLAARKILSELAVFSAKDYLRRRNDEFISEVAFAVESKAFPNKKDGLNELFVTYERQGMPAEALNDLERRFGRALAELNNTVSTLRKTRFRNKSDFYSLFIFLANNAEHLPLTDDLRQEFTSTATEFSRLVNEIKRQESTGGSIDDLLKSPHGESAVKYLRAVERAASDRLSRVRRNEALIDVLAPIISKAASTPLSREDAEWRLEQEPQDETEDEFAEEYERMRSRKALLEAETDSLD